nr:hypothetical protein [Tanacetum cinerariifolium]GEZ13622.1 hypothetical protein [Tanacetum cinerariifolium]
MHSFRNVMVWVAMTEAFRQKKNQPTMPSWHSPPQVLPVLTMSSESDVSMPASLINDRYQLGEGYHAVPPPYTGTFMPPKPDFVFHDTPNVNKTVHIAFNVELSLTKPDKDLSYTYRPSTPIIEDWVSDSEDDYEIELPQNAPSFVQPTKQVKTPRPSVKPVEHSIPTANHKKDIPKPKSLGNSRNRKACFVCKSLTYMIKDCDYYEKKMAQTPTRNHAQRGNHWNYARMTLPNPQRHVVPTSVLTKSKLVPLTAARPITIVVSHSHVTRPRPAKTVVTKPHSPPRRHIDLRPTPKPSNFPQKVTTVKAPKVNAFKGVKGNWDKRVIDSGCSRHMIGNMTYLSNFEEINGGYVAFGGNPKGGKISGKGKIRTGKLDFDDVYFVKELKFNLFSVSQMCDKKNNVIFTNTECLVLSPEFKLLDENQVLLIIPRENNMYNVDLKNIVPSGDLTCLFAKTTLDEGLPSRVFENNQTYVACKKGKQHRASCKTKPVSSVSQPLYSNTGTEFKNQDITQFCGMKGIKREFSVPKTPQPNGIAKRKNKTLIEAARTMLAESLLPIPFWAEVVNTACYVHNGVLVTKPHNKTPYELLHGRTPSIGFMRPFGCPVTILNTLDPLGKKPEFEGEKPESKVHVSPSSSAKTKKNDDRTKREAKGKRFKDLDYPNKVYKLVKALYGLHQAPRDWSISTNKDLCKAFEKLMKDKSQMSSIGELTFFLGLQVKQKPDGIFISQVKYVDEKSASTPIDTEKPLLKDPDGEDVDVRTNKSMIGSLMYLTSSRPDIMFAVCAYARFQVTPKSSHLHAVKRIFRYLKGMPHLGLWYPKYSPFNLVAYSNSDYAGASLDRKSTTGGCQFLGCRLIFWQCKK